MTIKECIDIVDNAKPNQYGIKEKVMWLSFVDETIINDVLKTHEGYDGRFDNFEGYTEDKLSVPLIVPSPYDRLYPQYIKMMIDSENGETARYNNSAALYNTYLNEYKKYYNKTHMPINATQKIPSPVSININSALSEAQIENIKRQLYYMLSEDFSEATSRDKLYDIVTNYVLNNLEMIRANDGKDGKDGEKGTTIHTVENFGLGKTTHVGMYFVNNKKGAGNGTIYKDFTMPKGFVHGDLLFDGKNGLMFDHDYREYSYTKDDVTYFETYDAILCIANLNGKDAVVDQELDWNSENAIANKTVAMKVNEISSVMSAIEGTSARTDLSNVSDEDFKAKAEAAGVGGDAGLAGETLTKTKLKIYPFSGMSNYDENVYSDGFITTDYVPDGTETYIFEPSRAIAPYFISAFFEPGDYSGSGVTDGIAYTIYCSKALEGVSEYGTLTILK